MKTVLLMSSFVSAAHVGAPVGAFCLQKLGVNVFTLPTTLFGRHPGWGPPGGQAVDAALISDMWQALRAQKYVIDAVLTGYMASAAQAKLAARIITEVRQDNPNAQIIVDPVMGDNGRLYISENVARHIIDNLVSRADIITPNLWELGYISGKSTASLADILNISRSLPPAALITSVPAGQNIGAVYNDGQEAYLVHHQKFDKVPHGGGDALAGTFLAHLLRGAPPVQALTSSVSSIFNILSSAALLELSDLPLIQFQDTLLIAPSLKPERLSFD